METPKYEWECELFGCGECIVISREKGKQPNWFWRLMQYLILGNKWQRISNMKCKFIGKPDQKFPKLVNGKVHDLMVEVIGNKPVIVKPFRCPYSSWVAFFRNWELVSSN